MTHMKPEIIRASMIDVDTDAGHVLVPAGVFNTSNPLEFTEGTKLFGTDKVSGWFARLSAPGFMDCTEWEGPFDTEWEAKAEIFENYEVCPDCGADLDDDKPVCAECGEEYSLYLSADAGSIIEKATDRYENGEVYDLACDGFRATVWNSHDVVCGRLSTPPVTSATAYVPVGSPGFPDGKLLVSRINVDGHGHHKKLLAEVVAMAKARLTEVTPPAASG